MGAAGRRYLRLFDSYGVKHIDVLRSGKSTIKEDLSPVPANIYFQSDEAFKNEYDAIVVCTPSSLHFDYIKKGIEKGINILTEKPVSSNLKDLLEIKDSLGSSVKFGVCHNLRYYPAIIKLKKIIESSEFGDPICASVQFCAYLPDWHPWEDYKTAYAGNSELGGGAALTHIHEIDYLNWFFGKPLNFNGIKSGKSFIDTDVDECTVINIEHESGAVSQVLLSLNTKPSKRTIMVYFTKGRVEADLIKHTMDYYDLEGNKTEIEFPNNFDFEDTYLKMIADFDNLITSNKSDITSIDEAIESTKIVTQI